MITPQDVLQLHAEQIERFGGDPTFYEHTLRCVSGAVGNAYQNAHYLAAEESGAVSLYSACLLLLYLAKDHCFCDGNKRTAWYATTFVLAKEGLTIKVTQEEAAAFVNDLAAATDFGEAKARVINWLLQRLTPFNF